MTDERERDPDDGAREFHYQNGEYFTGSPGHSVDARPRANVISGTQSVVDQITTVRRQRPGFLIGFVAIVAILLTALFTRRP